MDEKFEEGVVGEVIPIEKERDRWEGIEGRIRDARGR